GNFCPVARLLGAKAGTEEAIIAQSTEFEIDEKEENTCPILKDIPELYFSRDMKGYGWIFRKGNFLNAGFGRLDRTDFHRHRDDFRTALEKRGVAASEAAQRFHGHAYLTYRRKGGRQRVGDGLLLIGDAAGIAAPHSGEGILPAVESALLAARAIIAAKGNYRRSNLEPYAAWLDRRCGAAFPEFSLPIPAALMGPIGARFLASHLFVRHVVLDRWFLHAGRKTLSS
ncbi:MAG TPA: hypothetical protein VMJ66_03400, partial [Geobacteraceae bacterium]|nr:hypothetical protein [Geobacteraceae bacterium]